MFVGSKDSVWKLEAPDMTYLLSTYSFLPTKQRHLSEFLTTKLTHHSMAMGNLNKSKETTPTTTTALKVAP